MQNSILISFQFFPFNKQSSIQLSMARNIYSPEIQLALQASAEAILASDALLITCGAGMGVDSGLPDFRGTEGFWKAYPPFAKLGLSFSQVANPEWFRTDPLLAWGFYGHRMKLYRATPPHLGFQIIRKMAEERFQNNYFVFTTNVDGHFEKSGFPAEKIHEVHGSINHLQCVQPCSSDIWKVSDEEAERLHIDEATFRVSCPPSSPSSSAYDLLPKCPHCKGLARPNVLMFGDYHWVENRSDAQEARYKTWLRNQDKERRIVVIDIGSGTAIPTARLAGEDVVGRDTKRRFLIRINVRESDLRTFNGTSAREITGASLPIPGKAALEEIARLIGLVLPLALL